MRFGYVSAHLGVGAVGHRDQAKALPFWVEVGSATRSGMRPWYWLRNHVANQQDSYWTLSPRASEQYCSANGEDGAKPRLARNLRLMVAHSLVCVEYTRTVVVEVAADRHRAVLTNHAVTRQPASVPA
jgi:hypothetical protein